MIPVGGSDVFLGNLMTSNYVYTSLNAAWLYKTSLPKMCHFSLNCKGDDVFFPMNSLEGSKERTRTLL
jgi:hypothetical protein